MAFFVSNTGPPITAEYLDLDACDIYMQYEAL